MPVSMAEFRRSVQLQDPTLAGVAAVYEENAPILGEGRNLGYPLPTLRFDNTPGGVVSFTREKALPTVGFRAINQPFTPSEGQTETVVENLALGGGRVVYDRALVKRYGEAAVRNQQLMQIKAFARRWNECFYKGDGSANTFNGLNARIAGKQSIDMEGQALDLSVLDEALLQLSGDNRVIVVGRGLLSRIFTASRMSANVNFTPETFGRSPATYNGVPLMLAGDNASEADILDFTEAGETTSLYVLSLGDNGVVGAQTAPLEIHYLDAGNKIDSTFDVEWDASFVIKNPRAAYRISGIANEPISPA